MPASPPITSPQSGAEGVVRAHTNDPRAAQCGDRPACEAAFVPDAVVWDGGPGSIFDGARTVPTTIGQEWVRGSTYEPSVGDVYLLGGDVGSAEGCDAGPSAADCLVLTIDGVGVKWPLADRARPGTAIVVRVEAAPGPTICMAMTCPTVRLVATEIVWQAAAGS